MWKTGSQEIRFIADGDRITAEVIDEKCDSEVTRTTQLLEEVFNRRNTGIREFACDIRVRGVKREMNKLYKELYEYQKEADNYDMLRIEALLDRDSEYAAFKRCYVRENLEYYPGLKELVA